MVVGVYLAGNKIDTLRAVVLDFFIHFSEFLENDNLHEVSRKILQTMNQIYQNH